VTVISRPGSTNKLPDGLLILRVDYSGDDISALVEALRGQHALIVTMAVLAPKDTMSKLIRAAAAAGVPYILPNWFGHDGANDALSRDSFLAEMRDRVRSEIQSLAVSAPLFLVCNFWYEFSLGGGPDRYGFDFRNRSLIYFDDGDVAINTSSWPQCGRAVAGLLGLKKLPDDEKDTSPTISQFVDNGGLVYISSFRLSQRDMFESVKRVTKTTDADWAITHESSEQRWKDGTAEMLRGNSAAFTKLLYSRMFFPNGDGDYESRRALHNDVLGLPVEDLDAATSIAVRMGENGEVAQGH
jgi:hypothetical protein